MLACNDAAGLLNEGVCVSAEGGTGTSALMLDQLGGSEVQLTTNGNLRHLAADGRVEFLLRENPERKIWHTVQVEAEWLHPRCSPAHRRQEKVTCILANALTEVHQLT